MWILPSFNRARRCQIALDAMVSCGVSSPGVVVVNGTRQIDDYRDLRLPEGWFLLELPENIGVCGAWNTTFQLFPDEPWYGTACDDEIAATPGFDKTLIEAAGRICVSHANDGFRSDTRIHSFVCMGGDLVRALGWISLPGLWHWFHDDVIELIASELDLRRYCSQVKCEHQHVENGHQDDLTYQTGRSRQDQDSARFWAWRANEWPELRSRLIRII